MLPAITTPDVATEPMVFARLVLEDGSVNIVDWGQARDWTEQTEAGLLWVHLSQVDAAVEQWLEKLPGVADYAKELFTSEENRPRAVRDGRSLSVVMHGLLTEGRARSVETTTVRILATQSLVVTFDHEIPHRINAILRNVDAEIRSVTPGDLVARLVDATISDVRHVIADLNEKVDRISASPDEPAQETLIAIGEIRRTCLAMKRHMSPQHAAILDILRRPPDWVKEEDRQAIHETVDGLQHYLGDLDIIKEGAVVIQEDITSRGAAQTNRTTYLLTIVAAIFLPLSFLTGLLGMNVGGTPGVNWHPAFWITLAAMVSLVTVQITLFRWLRWI